MKTSASKTVKQLDHHMSLMSYFVLVFLEKDWIPGGHFPGKWMMLFRGPECALTDEKGRNFRLG